MPDQPSEAGFHPERVDLLIQFCLAVTGEGDPGERALGQIHLIKYVYLADLIYAGRHQGQTFTGAPWRFHHFGPWATEVWQRIDPATSAVGIHPVTISSPQYENDFIRYQAGQELSADELDRFLPIEIAIQLRTLIKKYKSFTPDLLHYVYKTKPMLKAAPEERLDFSNAIDAEQPARQEEEPISKAKLSKFKKALAAAREKNAQARKRVRVEPLTPPSYDDDFFEVCRALEDRECGLESCQGTVCFSDEVWKSKAREGAD